MVDFDVAIVGSGIIGLATACALSDKGMNIAIITANEKIHCNLHDEKAEVRASAINQASQQYFNQIGIWDSLINSGRVSSFDSIDVQEEQGFAQLDANSECYQYDCLGYIIENQLIQNQLYEKLTLQSNVSFFYHKVEDLFFSSDRGFIQLDNGKKLASKLIIAADGANSFIRRIQNIKMFQRPYLHHAVIATVKSEHSHQACARQIFYPDGIVAFLPLWKADESCLVWSTKPQYASELVTIDNKLFSKKLDDITKHIVGRCQLVSDRYTFPLTARYCFNTVQERLILVGDAAHTIHPLAGQGANLGLKDSKQLTDIVNKLYFSGHDIGLKRHFYFYQLNRHKDTLMMLSAMQGIQDIFDGKQTLKKVSRGVGMNVINRFPFIKKHIIEYAMN